MNPSRDEIFEEADSLREQLLRAEALARSVERGATDRMPPLRMLGLELLDLLAGRIAREQWTLLPALRASRLPDAARAADLLEVEQREQSLLLREQLDALVDERRPPTGVARDLRHFAGHMLRYLDDAVHLAPEALPLRADVFVDVEVA